MEGPEMEWTDGKVDQRLIALVLGSRSRGLKQCSAEPSEARDKAGKARQEGPGETWKWRG